MSRFWGIMARKTLEEAKDAILQFAAHKGRPIVIGEAAIMLGAWSLSETEELMREMVDEKTLRPTTKEEGRRFSTSFGFVRCRDPHGSKEPKT